MGPAVAITLEFRARVGELERLAHGLVRGGSRRGRLGTGIEAG